MAGFRRRRATTRTRFSGSRGSRQGRQGLWLRQPTFSLSLVDASVGIFGDIIYTPSSWEREVNVTTRPQLKGGTRLEYFDLQFDVQSNYDPTGGIAVAPSAEFILFTQEDAFAFYVTSNATFDTVITQSANRLLWFESVPLLQTQEASGQNFLHGSLRHSKRAKARLQDKSIALAVRLNLDSSALDAVENLTKLTCWVSTP